MAGRKDSVMIRVSKRTRDKLMVERDTMLRGRENGTSAYDDLPYSEQVEYTLETVILSLLQEREDHRRRSRYQARLNAQKFLGSMGIPPS